MAKLLLLGGEAHGGTCWVQFAIAARHLGHDVVTVAPRFGRAQADQWLRSLRERESEWISADAIRLYVEEVYAARLEPDLPCTPGQLLGGSELPAADAVVAFDQYGETPRIGWTHALHDRFPRRAAVYGDTHTGHLARQAQAATDYHAVFVQFRRADIAAFTAAGCPSVHWLPAAADPEVWLHVPDLPRRYDVVVCASMDAAVHAQRVATVRALQAAGLDVHVTRAFGSRAALLYNQAGVVLNRSLAGDLNLRVPEAMATGALLVTDAVDGLTAAGYGGGDELPCVLYDGDGVARTVDLVRELLGEPEQTRRRRGAAGRALVLAHHTWEHRVRQVLDMLLAVDSHTSTESRAGRGVSEQSAAAARAQAPAASGGQQSAAAESLACHAKRGETLVAGDSGAVAPHVSIVIPAYNHWTDLTRPLLDQLLDSDEPSNGRLEIIVVDDGSSDETATLEAWRSVRIIHHASNRGIAAAINTGVSASCAPHIVVMGNDNRPEPGWLQPLLTELYAGAGIAGPLVLLPEGTRSIDGSIVHHEDMAFYSADERARRASRGYPQARWRRSVFAVSGTCSAMRRDAWERVGGFDADRYARGPQDLDFCIRVAQAGYAIVHTPHSRVLHLARHSRYDVESYEMDKAATRRLGQQYGGQRIARHCLPRAELSIIIPVYNRWMELTKPLIESLLTQEEVQECAEVVIVDDGSIDVTRQQHSAQVPGVRVVRLPSNQGFAAACNAGAVAARGRWLLFLNNDTQPQPGWLWPLLEELAAQDCIVGPLLRFPADAPHARAGQVQSAGLRQDGDGRWWNQETVPEAVRTEQLAVTGACLGIRRDTFCRLGGFPEDYGKRAGCEDVHLCLLARAAGLPVVVRRDSVVVHAEGTTRTAGLDDPRQRQEFDQELVTAQTLLRDRFGLLRAAAGSAAGQEPAQHEGAEGSAGDVVAAGGDRAVERRGRTAVAARPTVVAWEGARDPQVAGSLAVINRALDDHLLGGDGSSGLSVFAINRDGRAVLGTRAAVPPTVDVWVSHLWPGTAPHRVPALPAAHWLVIQPWEYGPYPLAWDQTFRDGRFRLLLTPSEHSRQLFLAGGVLRPEQVRVVPNGVDTQHFCPQGRRFTTSEATAQHFRVLFVGGPTWRKGLDLLYAAWQQAFLPSEPVRLVIKAQGADSFYRGQAIPPPADGHGGTIQVLARHFDEEELARLYRTVDLVCQPSRAEGFGLPVLEAMASATPVLVPDQGAMTEFVPADWSLLLRGQWTAYQGQGDHGPIVWPLGKGSTPSSAPAPAPAPGKAPFVYEVEVEELARALRWCFLHRDELRALGARLRPVAERYDWVHIAAQYAAVLREVAAQEV